MGKVDVAVVVAEAITLCFLVFSISEVISVTWVQE